MVEAKRITNGIDGLRNLCKILVEHFFKKVNLFLQTRHQTLLLPALEYVRGIATPKFQNEMDGKTILIDENGKKFIQQAVAAKNLHCSPVGRFDAVIIT